MAFYAVSYDLHNQRNYPPVWAKLESWGATRILETLWLLDSTLSAVQIRDALVAIVDNDDSIVVVEIKSGSCWAAIRSKEKGVAWLRQKIAA